MFKRIISAAIIASFVLSQAAIGVAAESGNLRKQAAGEDLSTAQAVGEALGAGKPIKLALAPSTPAPTAAAPASWEPAGTKEIPWGLPGKSTWTARPTQEIRFDQPTAVVDTSRKAAAAGDIHTQLMAAYEFIKKIEEGKVPVSVWVKEGVGHYFYRLPGDSSKGERELFSINESGYPVPPANLKDYMRQYGVAEITFSGETLNKLRGQLSEINMTTELEFACQKMNEIFSILRDIAEAQQPGRETYYRVPMAWGYRELVFHVSKTDKGLAIDVAPNTEVLWMQFGAIIRNLWAFISHRKSAPVPVIRDFSEADAFKELRKDALAVRNIAFSIYNTFHVEYIEYKHGDNFSLWFLHAVMLPKPGHLKEEGLHACTIYQGTGRNKGLFMVRPVVSSHEVSGKEAAAQAYPVFTAEEIKWQFDRNYYDMIPVDTEAGAAAVGKQFTETLANIISHIEEVNGLIDITAAIDPDSKPSRKIRAVKIYSGDEQNAGKVIYMIGHNQENDYEGELPGPVIGIMATMRDIGLPFMEIDTTDLAPERLADLASAIDDLRTLPQESTAIDSESNLPIEARTYGSVGLVLYYYASENGPHNRKHWLHIGHVTSPVPLAVPVAEAAATSYGNGLPCRASELPGSEVEQWITRYGLDTQLKDILGIGYISELDPSPTITINMDSRVALGEREGTETNAPLYSFESGYEHYKVTINFGNERSVVILKTRTKLPGNDYIEYYSFWQDGQAGGTFVYKDAYNGKQAIAKLNEPAWQAWVLGTGAVPVPVLGSAVASGAQAVGISATNKPSEFLGIFNAAKAAETPLSVLYVEDGILKRLDGLVPFVPYGSDYTHVTNLSFNDSNVVVRLNDDGQAGAFVYFSEPDNAIPTYYTAVFIGDSTLADAYSLYDSIKGGEMQSVDNFTPAQLAALWQFYRNDFSDQETQLSKFMIEQILKPRMADKKAFVNLGDEAETAEVVTILKELGLKEENIRKGIGLTEEEIADIKAKEKFDIVVEGKVKDGAVGYAITTIGLSQPIMVRDASQLKPRITDAAWSV